MKQEVVKRSPIGVLRKTLIIELTYLLLNSSYATHKLYFYATNEPRVKNAHFFSICRNICYLRAKIFTILQLFKMWIDSSRDR